MRNKKKSDRFHLSDLKPTKEEEVETTEFSDEAMQLEYKRYKAYHYKTKEDITSLNELAQDLLRDYEAS